jgi:hypothetical protein
MARYLKAPILFGLLVVFWGGITLLRGLWQASPEKLTIQLDPPRIQLRSEEVQLVFFSDPLNLALQRPMYKTLELPQDKEQRLVRILSALRDNLEGLWPDALPLPTVFIHQQAVVMHFLFESPVRISVGEEQRLYESIIKTLKENGFPEVRILVNDQSETFLGHRSLENRLE